MTKKWRRVYAWVLTVAMVLSMANLPITIAKAASTQNLTVKSGATSVTIAKNEYGDDYIGDMFFNIPDALKTKSAISSNKVTSMTVKITIKSFTQGSGAKAQAFIFAQPDASGDWNWNQSSTAELVTGSQLTLTYSFADMDWKGGTTLGNLGVRFANAAEGSTVSYSVDSAVINMADSGSSATSKPSSATSKPSSTASAGGNVSTDQIAITRSVGSGTNDYYAEYSFSITNNSSETVRGIQILIPTSGSVDVGYVEGFSAVYDAALGGVVAYYSTEIAAGATVSSSSNKVGFGKQPSISVGESNVIAVNCAGPSTGDELNYELTGRKDVAYADTPVGRHGKLSVQKVDGYAAPIMVDQNGVPTQLRGASTHGMHWFPQYVNQNAFQTLRDDWGINMVRLVCYPRDVGSVGYLTGGDSTKQQLDTLIQNGVDYATKLGMYALVDWHVHAYNPNEYLKEAKIFFTKYATMYKDHDNVLYEICNEPTGTNWYSGNGKDLYTYCSEVIKTIRAIDPDAIIICGTNTWSQDVDQVAAKPMKALGYENIMYTFHFYSATHKENLMKKVRLATKDGTPIFVTEFGICSADGNGSYDAENADRWIELLDELNISFACWSYSNCNEKSAYFKSSCSNAGGDWTADDLTTTGKWLINTCRAHEEKENASYPAVSPSAGPTKAPTVTEKPTTEPTKAPTVTVKPTAEPTKAPTVTVKPTAKPTKAPTVTEKPTAEPTKAPTVTVKPTAEPTKAPTVTEKPTAKPIKTPTPTAEPTKAPEPTAAPIKTPEPTAEPTKAPEPTAAPIKTPTPTAEPTKAPMITPVPSDDPTESAAPSEKPTITPTQKPGIQATGMRVIASVKKVSNLPVKSKLQLAAGKSMQLTVTLLPTGAKPQKLTYTSSKPSIAKVSGSGKIVAGKKAGTTVITIRTANGLQKRLTIRVMKKAVKKIKLSGVKKLKVGKKLKLKAKITPKKKYASATVFWVSGNTKIATVTQSGVVKAKKKGKVKITAIATDGSGKKKVIKLTIK
mgnify:CR=1 FL=1